MSGRDRNWEQFALLLIDVQNDFWPEEISGAFPDFRENVSALLDVCRTEGIDVIHLRARFKEDQSDWMPIYRLGRKLPCIEGTPGVELLPEAMEIESETVIEKQCFDGFLMDELEPHLQHLNKRFILTAGLVTSICVFLTTVSAMQRGYLTAIIEDCCADEPKAHSHVLDRYAFMFEKTGSKNIVDKYETWQEMIRKADLNRKI